MRSHGTLSKKTRGMQASSITNTKTSTASQCQELERFYQLCPRPTSTLDPPLPSSISSSRTSPSFLTWTFNFSKLGSKAGGGHDEKAEQLCCNLAKEMDTYPSSFWLELVNK